jgi:hypothetical protein
MNRKIAQRELRNQSATLAADLVQNPAQWTLIVC